MPARCRARRRARKTRRGGSGTALHWCSACSFDVELYGMAIRSSAAAARRGSPRQGRQALAIGRPLLRPCLRVCVRRTSATEVIGGRSVDFSVRIADSSPGSQRPSAGARQRRVEAWDRATGPACRRWSTEIRLERRDADAKRRPGTPPGCPPVRADARDGQPAGRSAHAGHAMTGYVITAVHRSRRATRCDIESLLHWTWSRPLGLRSDRFHEQRFAIGLVDRRAVGSHAELPDRRTNPCPLPARRGSHGPCAARPRRRADHR